MWARDAAAPSWQAAYRANYHAEPKGQPVNEHGVDFLIRNIKARPHEITIVSIGTSANLAAAIRRAPEIVPLVKRVVYMGGAFFQQYMGKILDGYTKVAGKFPVEAYASTFWLCFGGMVAGTIVLFFTVETFVQKEAPPNPNATQKV